MANRKRQTTEETEAPVTPDVFSGEVEAKDKTASPKLPDPKDLVLRQVKNTALYKFQWPKGGNVPAYLRGLYTSPGDAQKALVRYEKMTNAASAS